MEIEFDTTLDEPPTKIMKIDTQQYPSLYVKLALTTLFDIQRAQRVIYSENPIKNGKIQPQFRQMAFNLTFVATDEDEFVAINKSIREILEWKPKKIPYLQMFVKDSPTRCAILTRSSTILASFAELPPCCIGIRIVQNKKDDEYMHQHYVTGLRRIIWSFILNEIDLIPPHIRIFLSAELKLMANEDTFSTPATFPIPQRQQKQTPYKTQVKLCENNKKNNLN